MAIEICTVGGFNEVGKNCTAVKVDDEVIILDMGLYLDKYIAYTEEDEEDIKKDMSAKKLTSIGAVPDLSLIKDWKYMTKAIVVSHAHLDHIGAIPFLAEKFSENVPVICTPYAGAILNRILSDEKMKIPTKIRTMNPNSSVQITPNIKIEFIYMTHSIPQTVMVLIHTKYGKVLYANDFKFDSKPTLGQKPNFERLTQLAKENVKCLILDSIYSKDAIKTPSESVAKEMLNEVLLDVNNKGKGVIVTTFSSHLARLKSIIECGKKMHRKIIFCGRSLAKYVECGEDIGIINFRKDADIIGFKSKIRKKLRKISDRKHEYLVVVTGHQGEPKAVLSRIISNDIPFRLGAGDHVVFSCTTIPSPVNIQNREELEQRLREKGVRIFKNVHVSGHAAREDHRDLIEMVKPKHIIPAHGDTNMVSPMAELAAELGYKLGENVHLMQDGGRIVIE